MSVSWQGQTKKYYPKGGDFLRLLVLPLGLCFCEQSERLTNTFLPVRFNPAWAGIQIINTTKIQKEDIGELEEMEHLPNFL